MACIDELSELNCRGEESSALEWTAPEGPSIAKIDSLFWYSGVVRTLTINAKVKGDISSLNRIIQIWSTEVKETLSLNDVDTVMPCPSSLWSRLHGRIDIAWFLAAKIAQMYRLKFMRPPRHIYWNLKKRSQLERPRTENLVVLETAIKLQSMHISTRHCLIVDDVVTTGSTLKTCIEHAAMLDFGKFSSLTFARAR